MRCEEARLLISAGLDGELTDQPAAGLREHVAQCELCQREQAALTCTVQLLRGLPEADPPAELRRRIGGALLEEERRAAKRRFGWAWLARPGTAGWAWGAAAGAALAAIVLVATQGESHAPRIADAPPPPAAMVLPATPVRPAPTANKISVVPQPVGPHSKRPSPPAAGRDDPRVIAVAPPSQAPSIEAPPAPFVEAPRIPHRAPVAHSRTHGRQHLTVRSNTPVLASLPARGAAARDEKVTPRPASADRDAPRVAWMNQPSSADSPAADPMDSDESSDTSNMTDMASMPMPAPATEPRDDLADLRRRLTDRPLQAPELGQLKPAGSGAGRRDGWIRF